MSGLCRNLKHPTPLGNPREDFDFQFRVCFTARIVDWDIYSIRSLDRIACDNFSSVFTALFLSLLLGWLVAMRLSFILRN